MVGKSSFFSRNENEQSDDESCEQDVEEEKLEHLKRVRFEENQTGLGFIKIERPTFN